MLTPLSYQNYRSYLKDLLDAKGGGRRLSLRGFARRSGMSPSYLSRIISGERKLTVAMASRITWLLDFGPEEEAHMMRLLAMDTLPEASPAGRMVRHRVSRTKKSEGSTIQSDQFQMISDWQHFAILSLMNVNGFRSDPKWIASRLGIPREKAAESLERLIKLGLAKTVGNTVVPVNDGDIETPHETPSQAVRENHRQHLTLAEAALRELSPELREFANCTMSLALKDLPKAKRRIRNFLDRFIKDVEAKPGDELFQFNLQFYQLTKNITGDSK